MTELEYQIFDKKAAECYKSLKKRYNKDQRHMEIVLVNVEFADLCKDMFQAGLDCAREIKARDNVDRSGTVLYQDSQL